MISFSRSDDRIFSRWWWVVDRVTLFSFLIMMIFGILLAMAATPMIANRMGIETSYFLKRHLLYSMPTLPIIFLVSLLDQKNIKRLSMVLFLSSLFLMLASIFLGDEIKGARRWIPVFGFSLQPSELAKPAFAVVTAWMFAEQREHPEFRGKFIAGVFLLIFDLLLTMQPDIGMMIIVTAVWFGQLFLNGLPVIFLIAALVVGAGGLAVAYLLLPHVTARIDRFLDPEIGDHYQINRSLEAFANGGLLGVGPGEGTIKRYVPDAHADFVFAVLGEEFGFFVCAFVIILIAFIVVHGILKSLKENNFFNLLASVGLLAQFGLQSFVNIASSLHVIPTKGMTLPFMSYGGSSMIATGIMIGMILALQKRKIGGVYRRPV
ncbi:MAG: putative lipid II flippase FtsW [Holosporaceae bacterium]|jgi:cell division protein FtsW|nr:putative lipid II flippase FtsW [Holosporaceae bacterium]